MNSGETLINIDELLMKDSISQSELRTAISSGPDSSRQTCYSYPTDEDGKAFPISIFARQQSNGERVKRDWLRWNCKGEALHCFSCPLFSTPPGPSKSSLSKPEGCTKWKKLHDKVTAHIAVREH